jgi:hypothetical protein
VQIAVAVILVIAAVAFFLYILQAMLNAAPCPVCLRDEGTREMVIPVFPAFRWLCPNCGALLKNSEVANGGRDAAGADDDPELDFEE